MCKQYTNILTGLFQHIIHDTAGIKLYNRTAWRGGRLRVEHASEAYMDRLRREWAERDGLPPPPPVAAAVAVAGVGTPEGDSVEDAQKGEGEEEGKVPKQERDKRYLRLRRKAGEKALVVDTLPVLLKGADAAALPARPGSKSVLKRPRCVIDSIASPPPLHQ